MKALVIGNTKIDQANHNNSLDFVGVCQVASFARYRGHLNKKLGLTTTTKTAETAKEIIERCVDASEDVFFIRPPWSLNPKDVEVAFAEIRQMHPQKKIVFIDPFDQTSSRFFGTLPYVDIFLKYQCLKSREYYKKTFTVGTIYSDYYTNRWSLEMTDELNTSSQVPEGHLDKILSGWNLGERKDFKRKLFISRLQPSIFSRKNIDVSCRVRIPQDLTNSYYGKQRILALEALEPLAEDYKLAANFEFNEVSKISSRQYKNELKRSRIALSPFGWGEQTWRDFEAICFGALLVKPSMEHIDTYPNIYIPGETYVPIEWDFSDLHEKCRFYLENPDETARIVNNARQLYINYFRGNGFVAKVHELLSRLNLL